MDFLKNNQTMKSFVIFSCILMALLALTGCNKSDKEKVRRYVAEVKSRRPPPADPLPALKKYEPFVYASQERRSPFVLPNRHLASGPRPDMDRPKEDLEAFPLDALRMVGTIMQHERVWALVSTPDGFVYRVPEGAYMGKNFGRIEKIYDNKLDIVESVPDGEGGWKKREAFLVLVENSQ